jgi:hypothetical protein
LDTICFMLLLVVLAFILFPARVSSIERAEVIRSERRARPPLGQAYVAFGKAQTISNMLSINRLQ